MVDFFFQPFGCHTKRDTDFTVCNARLPAAESNGAHVRFTRKKNCRVFSVLYSATVELVGSIIYRSRMLFVTLILFVATVGLPGRAYASSNPLDLNGGSCLVMAGKDCVAMAVDRWFGLEEQLVSAEAKRVLKVCLSGLRAWILFLISCVWLFSLNRVGRSRLDSRQPLTFDRCIQGVPSY